jgi:peptide deformylase
MAVREILLLGNPKLYEICEPVQKEELASIREVVQDLHDTMRDFRARWNAGRAIAAPQIGAMKRVVYMEIDEPVVLINPVFDELSDEMMTLWDDCMSFPELLVRVQRHRRCRIRFRDLNWEGQSWELEDDLSELLQHEVDHLDGILAVNRALDDRSIALRSQKALLE